MGDRKKIVTKVLGLRPRTERGKSQTLLNLERIEARS